LILSLPVARATSFESGLLGLAVSPTFADDHTFYVSYTAPTADTAPTASRLARYTLTDGIASEETILLDLPARPDQQYHFGGALTFGPDGKLYLIFGDTNPPDEARNPQTPYGAVLRLNPEGGVPDDNPFPGSYVYAYGIRNGFGLAWQPETGVLYETENGASCDDELNRIERGQDYGWGLHPYATCPYPDDATPPPRPACCFIRARGSPNGGGSCWCVGSTARR
jgi:glucose/arabinose dehydrogenase